MTNGKFAWLTLEVLLVPLELLEGDEETGDELLEEALVNVDEELLLDVR